MVFDSEEDGRGRLWKVIQDKPTLDEERSTILVQCWFPALNFLVNVDLLKIADLADTQEMVTLLAYVQMNFLDVKYFDMKKTTML